jgi:hypothetical protein
LWTSYTYYGDVFHTDYDTLWLEFKEEVRSVAVQRKVDR